MNLPRLALTLAPLLVVGCFPKSAPPPSSVSDEVAARSASDRSELETGRAVFVAKCGECHAHPDIASVGSEEWPSILDRMSEKSKLSPTDAKALRAFVLAAASR